MRRQLGLLFLFVFVDVLGFSLILPLLPYYANTFGASDTVVGLLLGANALTQLVGAPIIGRLSDRYGRRPLLLLSLTGTVISFLLLGWGVPYSDVNSAREALRLLIKNPGSTTPYEVIILDDIDFDSEIKNFLVALSQDLSLPNIKILVAETGTTAVDLSELKDVTNVVHRIRQPFDNHHF